MERIIEAYFGKGTNFLPFHFPSVNSAFNSKDSHGLIESKLLFPLVTVYLSDSVNSRRFLALRYATILRCYARIVNNAPCCALAAKREVETLGVRLTTLLARCLECRPTLTLSTREASLNPNHAWNIEINKFLIYRSKSIVDFAAEDAGMAIFP